MNRFLSKLLGACLVAFVAVGGSALPAHVQAAAVSETQVIYNAKELAAYLNTVQSGTASVSGSKVTLKKNITLSEYVAFENQAKVTLDLQGYTVTFSNNTGFLSLAGSTFTLTDAGAVIAEDIPTVNAYGGTVNIVKDTTSAHASVCGYTKGVPELIQKGTDSSALACIYHASTESVLYVEDVYIQSSGLGITLTGGTTTIKKASVHAAREAITANMATPANAASALNISGGTFESNSYATVNISGTGYTEANDCTAKLTISGGSFIATAKSASNISLWKGAALVIPEDNTVKFSTNGGAGIIASTISTVNVSDVTIPGIYLQSGAIFTASDSKIVANGRNPILGNSSSVVTLKNTTVTTSLGCAIMMNDATLSVEGGRISSTSDSTAFYSFPIQGLNKAQLTINDCHLKGVSGVRLASGSTLSLEGSTIKSTADEASGIGTGVYIEGGSAAYIDSTDITANRGIECYEGSSLTFLGGSITGLKPLNVDYCDPDAKICIVDSGASGITITATGTSAPLCIEAEPADLTGYGLLQLSENVYNQIGQSDYNVQFVKDKTSGSYVTANTDLTSYRKYLVKSPVIYTVTYVGAKGADNADLNPTSVNSLKSYKLVNLTKDGYVFGGWYKDTSYKKAITEIDHPTSNLKLYAKFTKISIKAPKLSYKVSTTGITLSWTKISGASAYAVYRAKGSGMKLIKKTTSLSFKDTGISNGNKVQYIVIPCFEDANGTASNEIFIRYYNKAATVKITSASTGNKLTIRGVPTSYTSYTIYRSDNGASYKALKTLRGKIKTYTDTKVTNGHKYTYYVIYKDTRHSGWNYVKSPASTKVTTYYLKRPTISYLKSTASKTATVKWAKNTKTTGYQIRYSTSSKMKNAKTVTITKKSTISKKLTKLTAKKKYYIQMRTYKTVKGKKYYSAWSSKKTVTIK